MKKILLVLAIFAGIIAFLLLRAKEAPPESVVLPDQRGWSVHVDEGTGIRLAMPDAFGANVWSPVQWPPRFSLIPAEQNPVVYGCEDFSRSSLQPATIYDEEAVVVQKREEPGAGTLYATYCAVKSYRAWSLVFYAEVRSHLGCGLNQCGAYCGTEFDAECRRFDRAAMIDTPIIEMAKSMLPAETF